MTPRGRPTASFFVQLLGLTLMTLVAAWAISFFLLMNLPPPAPDFYRLSEIERTFRGATLAFGDRHPLVLNVASAPPGPELEGRNSELGCLLEA